VLGSDSPDTEWHAVRIRAKRCRYTAEAVAPICGHQAKRFAAAIAEVQASVAITRTRSWPRHGYKMRGRRIRAIRLRQLG
jgi:hypothetical protein